MTSYIHLCQMFLFNFLNKWCFIICAELFQDLYANDENIFHMIMHEGCPNMIMLEGFIHSIIHEGPPHINFILLISTHSSPSHFGPPSINLFKVQASVSGK